MLSSVKTNKIDMPQNASFVQTNKAFSWLSNDIFDFSAIKIRDINGFSQANRMDIANIKSFTQLAVNWDGYGAAPISPIAIEKAINFIHEINKYDIDAYLSSPGPNGEVMVQLKHNSREIELVFYEGKSKYVLFSNKGFESQGDYSPAILHELVAWLSENE